MKPETIKQLEAPLDRKCVKQRQQAGRQMSYIEGWHAIAEANRIFGFDSWTRETIEIRAVSEGAREIGAAKRPGFSVTYIARVRVRVGDVVREGVGAGHGIDQDLGQAHESAIKEAETDAMKRALMTFGNPFGLALYDKTQANVCEKDKRDVYMQEATQRITMPEYTKEDLAAWWQEEAEARREAGLTQEDVNELKAAMLARFPQAKEKAA